METLQPYTNIEWELSSKTGIKNYSLKQLSESMMLQKIMHT